ncbi:MAG: hypothetical protein AAF439_08045 [Pseudomonadota bacterium]
MIRLAAIMLALCVAVPAAAQEISAPRVSWAPEAPDVGDLIMLRVEIDVPYDHLVSFPRLRDKQAGFRIDGRLVTEPLATSTGTRTWVQEYRLEPQSTGTLAVPDLAILIHDPKTLVEAAAIAAEIRIPVRSLVAEDADPRFIKPERAVMALRPAQSDLLPWILGLLAGGVALIVLAYAFLTRRRDVTAAEQSRPPGEEALERLDALRAKVDDAEADRRFHDDLAAVLRTYLDRGLSVAAPRRTTTETGVALRGVLPDAAPATDILRSCDGVKFARGISTTDARERLKAGTAEFIRATLGQGEVDAVR